MIAYRDYLYMSFSESLDREGCKFMPTVCLMIADQPVGKGLIDSVVKDAIAIGCQFFMTWGSWAEALHDAVDEVVENGDDDLLNIITTSHEGESLVDVLDFLHTGALPGNRKFRCLIVGDKSDHDLRTIVVPR